MLNVPASRFIRSRRRLADTRPIEGSDLSRRHFLQLSASASLALAATGFARAGAGDPVVSTREGDVRGTIENGIAVFRGIPYAEAPVGRRRFKPPVRRAAWDGVRDATRFGDIVPQTDESHIDEIDMPPGVSQGDDCLNLNVWTPDLGSAGLPVLVWLHGGGFSWGAGSVVGYNGATFAREGIVTGHPQLPGRRSWLPPCR